MCVNKNKAIIKSGEFTMELTKQDKTMNEIIYSVTHGEKKEGDMILARDYDLSKTQMGMVFRTLVEREIIYKSDSNYYFLKENCAVNAQEMYFEKIIEALQKVKLFADTANIPTELLLDIFKNNIDEQE